MALRTSLAQIARGNMGVRTVDELECVASVLLAVGAAREIGAHNLSWAAFAGYMVMRGHAADTFARGALRIAGTVAGGALALALAPAMRDSVLLTIVALVLVSTTTLYAALIGRRAYAWLFLGLTFAMAALDGLASGGETDIFVSTRVTETLIGTLACIGVSVLSTVSLRRRWPGERAPRAVGSFWHRDAARHAVEGGVAIAADRRRADPPRPLASAGSRVDHGRNADSRYKRRREWLWPCNPSGPTTRCRLCGRRVVRGAVPDRGPRLGLGDARRDRLRRGDRPAH